MSTDIDILVEPGTDVDRFIREASKLFPFKAFEEDRRVGKNNIEKRHFRFVYSSPLRKEDFFIILDIVFADNPYHLVERCELRSDLLLFDGAPVLVSVPSAECILGDKLTAFAPHTTGIPFGVDKELEIVKQLFDVSMLAERVLDCRALAATYDRAVVDEIGYRDLTITRDDVLRDTIQSCACVAGKGVYDKEEYFLFLRGIRAVGGHVLSMKYGVSIAAEQACRVMHLASCLLARRSYVPIVSPEDYLQENIGKTRYKKLSYMRNQSAEAFAHVVEALRNLGDV